MGLDCTSETYNRLLANAPYFWQYLMAEAGRNFDLEDPAMKGAAVRDVLEAVSRIQDGVERLEVAKSVAEGFKVPESLVLERLKLTGRPPELQPVRRPVAISAERKLPEAEKQLIQALVQDRNAADAVAPLRNDAFWKEVWSYPVVMRLLDMEGDVERALADIEDEALASEVRAAVMDAPSNLRLEHVIASIYKLYDFHLVQQEREIQEQLNSYRSEGAPRELLVRRQEIVAERNRIRRGMTPAS